MADATDLKSVGATRVGSNPTRPTKVRFGAPRCRCIMAEDGGSYFARGLGDAFANAVTCSGHKGNSAGKCGHEVSFFVTFYGLF